MKTQGARLGRCITLFPVLFMISSSFTEALAHPIAQYWENRATPTSGLILDPKVSFFNSSANFDSNSKSTSLSNNVSANQYYLDLNLAFGFTEELTGFARISALSETFSGSTHTALSNFGLSDQVLGLNYKLFHPKQGFELDLQAETLIPAYSNSTAKLNSKAYLGDGSTDFTVGGFAKLLLIDDFALELGLGYTYRSSGFSASLPASFLLKKDPEVSGLLLRAGLLAQFSMSTDTSSSSASALAQVLADNKAGARGSYLIDGINSSWLSVHGSLGYKIASGETFYAEATAPFQGTSAPGGFVVSAGIQFNFNSHEKIEGMKLNAEEPKVFSTYDLEASVTSVNDQLYLIKIDKGSTDQIEIGQIFDIFKDENRVARAKVSHLKREEAALTVLEYYQGKWVEAGFTARRIVK